MAKKKNQYELEWEEIASGKGQKYLQGGNVGTKEGYTSISNLNALREETRRKQQEEINNRSVDDWKKLRDAADLDLKSTQNALQQKLNENNINARVQGKAVINNVNYKNDLQVGEVPKFNYNALQENQDNTTAMKQYLQTQEAKDIGTELNEKWNTRAEYISGYETKKAQEDEKKLGVLSKLALSPVQGAASMFSWTRGDLTTDEGMLPSYNETMIQQTRENAENPLLRVGYGALGEIGKQGVVRVLNQVIPGAHLGTIAYFGDIANDQYNSAIRRGYSEDAARNYALLSTGAEALFERFLGSGSSYFGGKMGAESVVSGVLKKFVKNETVNNLLSGMISEGTEEFLEEYLGEFNEQLTLNWADKGEDIDWDKFKSKEMFNQALESGMIGAITGAYGGGMQQIYTPKDVRNVNQAIYTIERQTGTKLSDANINTINTMQYISEEMGRPLSAKELVDNYNNIKQTQTNTFKNSALEMFPNLDENSQRLYNNLINDVSTLIDDTGVSIKFDSTLDTVSEWDNGTLKINPTMTNTPIKTLLLKELGTELLDNKTKRDIIKGLKQNGVYDALKQELLDSGEFDSTNVDNEIISRELNNLLVDQNKLTQLAKENKSAITKLKDMVNNLTAKLGNRNTKDSTYLRQAADVFNSLNLKEDLTTAQLEKQNNQVIEDNTQNQLDNVEQPNQEEIQGMNATRREVEDAVYDKFEQMMDKYGYDIDNVESVYLHGSRLRGTARPDSDLDAVVFYMGNENEDDIFNTINDEDNQLEIDGVKVDINPVSIDSLSEIENYINRSEEYDREILSKQENKDVRQETINKNVNSKTLNPTQIANLKPEDASTTPNLEQRTYNKKGDGDSKQVETLQKSELFTEEQKQRIIEDEEFAKYDKITNKKSLNEAFNKLEKGGVEETLRWMNNKSKVSDATDIAEGIILMKQYADNGNYDSMVEVAKKLREMKTITAQALQASSIMSRMTPEGMVAYAQSELTEAYNKMVKNKTKEWIDNHRAEFELSTSDVEFIMDTMKKVSQMEDGYDKKVELAKIQKLMTDKIPPDTSKAIKGWMRLSMLFNPKTQVRNVVGNALITPVNAASDFVASWVDKSIAKKTNVRTTGNANVRAYLDGVKRGAYEATNDYKLGINTKDMSGNRFEIGEGKSFSEKTIIGKGLNRAEGILNYMMDVGDRVFSEGAFENSLANQMKLNNVDTPTQEMIDIATTEALQRTWNDNNNYTKFVLDVRRMLNRIGGENYGLGDILIPFAKTPANLTKAIVDYSPAGLVNSLLQYNNMNKAISRGDFTPQQQHQFVQTLGKATAGTMLYVLGAALASAGVITGKDDEDKDTKNFIKNVLGTNQYSIKIGNKSFTYDWAQPIAAPFSIMANVMTRKNNKGSALFESILGSLDTAGSILLEQSFLQSINDVLSDNDGIVSGLINEILQLPARAVPTFSKQVADLVDGTQRQTFEYNKPVKTALNSILVKIPFASKTLAPKVDTMGSDILKYGGKNNIFNVMFNPANVNKENVSKAGQEIYDVYKATGDSSIMPRVAPYYINKNGEKTLLNSKQIAEYQKISGSVIEKSMNEIMNDPKYKNASESEKASIIKNIVDYSYNYARDKVLGIDMPSTYNKANQFVNGGGNVGDYYLNSKEINYSLENPERYKVISQITSYDNYNKYSNDITELRKNTTNDKEETINYIDSLDLSLPQKAMMIKLYYKTFNTYNTEIINYIDESVPDYNDKVEILTKLGFSIDNDGNVRW